MTRRYLCGVRVVNVRRQTPDEDVRTIGEILFHIGRKCIALWGACKTRIFERPTVAKTAEIPRGSFCRRDFPFVKRKKAGEAFAPPAFYYRDVI